ncbi:MAG: hypothetical protein ACLVI9_04860 [Anaerostipes hadrus]
MYGVWKDWADDIEPYFVALKVKAGKIVSYSQVDSEFNMNFLMDMELTFYQNQILL